MFVRSALGPSIGTRVDYIGYLIEHQWRLARGAGAAKGERVCAIHWGAATRPMGDERWGVDDGEADEAFVCEAFDFPPQRAEMPRPREGHAGNSLASRFSNKLRPTGSKGGSSKPTKGVHGNKRRRRIAHLGLTPRVLAY
jgi:hypothetical protein